MVMMAKGSPLVKSGERGKGGRFVGKILAATGEGKRVVLEKEEEEKKKARRGK